MHEDKGSPINRQYNHLPRPTTQEVQRQKGGRGHPESAVNQKRHTRIHPLVSLVFELTDRDPLSSLLFSALVSPFSYPISFPSSLPFPSVSLVMPFSQPHGKVRGTRRRPLHPSNESRELEQKKRQEQATHTSRSSAQ